VKSAVKYYYNTAAKIYERYDSECVSSGWNIATHFFLICRFIENLQQEHSWMT
jgi:hypothetical protein